MASKPHRQLSVNDFYPRTTHRWHTATFSDYFGVELIIDDQLGPGIDFAISGDGTAVYLPSQLTPLGFHHRLIEAGVTLSCGPTAIPELIRAASPFLVAAYGKLVTPKGYR